MDTSPTLLLLTATDIESRAVLAAFSAIGDSAPRPIAVGDRVYLDLGSLRGTRLLLARTEMGAGGLGASLQTVQRAIAALRPSAVVMVGIAFGVDPTKQAIGDILVSRQLVLYEPQRVGKDGNIHRGSTVQASTRMLNVFNIAATSWDASEATVRLGPLLSGEKLVDRLEAREQLQALAPEAIGGEMEGAGLYAACQDAKVDWILIKAICDWADGHKGVDKTARQELAARNAARFVAQAVAQIPLPPTGPTINRATERRLLRECIDAAFTGESDLREFCFDHFDEVHRELRELDRRRSIAQSLIAYCQARGVTGQLWELLGQRNPDCAQRHAELLQ